jgi:hypothetical protein
MVRSATSLILPFLTVGLLTLDSVKALQNILRRLAQDHRASVRTGCGRRSRQESID